MGSGSSQRRGVVRIAALTVAAAAALCANSAAPASAAQPGCTLTPTAGTVSRTVGGRTYLLNVPAGLTGTQVPLLLSLHGAGSNGQQDEYFTGWTPFAAAHNFIVAYPQARPSSGSGVWDPYSAGTVDVPFLRQVADDISASWCIDPHHVHVDGWSNGAVMSQRVACDAADRFASVTSYGGGTPTLAGFATPCRPSRPISVGLFAGQYDFTYAGLAQNTDEWRAVDACGSTPAHTTDPYGSLDTYACAGGSTLLARVVSNTSHNWPFGAQAEDQRSRMWSFFQANPLP
jgi:polyhydroxybutyrate depolymerase